MDCPGDDRVYLNIGHTGLNSPGFADWAVRTAIKPAYFVHDLIPITHPSFCRAGESERHRERMRTVLTTALGIIGNSEATLDELRAFADIEGLSHPSMVAAWLGAEPLQVTTSTDRALPTFVALGTIEARKNHRLLLEIWAELADQLGERTPRLLIIGQRGWEADEVFEMLDRNDPAKSKVLEIGHCSDAELGSHLGSATALLFPSRAEGFGLPLVEALGAGVPVLASDLPVFREICGDLPDFFDPDDKGAWKQAILDSISTDSPRRSKQLRRIQGFKPPVWKEHFRRVRAWIAELA
ncbi:MAG: glycosyltransferase family 4 protein [Sphingomicrobium sp.]|jgi:glycosyltransferase involved in cell wall biosynthesis